jgi:hypothetical protein
MSYPAAAPLARPVTPRPLAEHLTQRRDQPQPHEVVGIGLEVGKHLAAVARRTGSSVEELPRELRMSNVLGQVLERM